MEKMENKDLEINFEEKLTLSDKGRLCQIKFKRGLHRDRHIDIL